MGIRTYLTFSFRTGLVQRGRTLFASPQIKKQKERLGPEGSQATTRGANPLLLLGFLYALPNSATGWEPAAQTHDARDFSFKVNIFQTSGPGLSNRFPADSSPDGMPLNTVFIHVVYD